MPRGADETALSILADELDALAEELGDSQRVTTNHGTEYRRDGRAFAAVGGRAAEFQLRPEVAAAALTTPATAASSRGRDWVALDPAAGDDFVFDRARAWFESAWRLAAPRRRLD